MKKVINRNMFNLFNERHASVFSRAGALGKHLDVIVIGDACDSCRGTHIVRQTATESFVSGVDRRFAGAVLTEKHESRRIEDTRKDRVEIFPHESDWPGRANCLRKCLEASANRGWSSPAPAGEVVMHTKSADIQGHCRRFWAAALQTFSRKRLVIGADCMPFHRAGGKSAWSWRIFRIM